MGGKAPLAPDSDAMNLQSEKRIFLFRNKDLFCFSILD